MSKMIPFPGTYQGEGDENTTMVPAARLALRATAGPLQGQRFEFVGEDLVIGRAPSCAISLPSQSVSRHHARVAYSDGAYWLVPEKTVNGTRVNGELVHEAKLLHDRDEIAIADSTFVVEHDDPMRDARIDRDLGELAPPPIGPGPMRRPSYDQMVATAPVTLEPQRQAHTPMPPPQVVASPNRRWFWIAGGAVGFLVIVTVVVIVTAKMMQSPAQPAPPVQVIAMTPAAAAPAPAPVPAPTPTPTPTPAPAPSAKLVGTLALQATPIVAQERGTLVDVAKVGSVIARGAAVGHQRVYPAAIEQAREHWVSLQKQFGDSPEHADFVEQAREEYVRAKTHRPVHPIAAASGGTVTKVAVKPGHEDQSTTVIAELAVARLTVPVAAVEGTGKHCTAELANGTKVEGDLLAIGSTERTIELDRVPKGAKAGDVGEVRVHCSGD